MIRIHRTALTPATTADMARRQGVVDAAETPAEVMATQWSGFRNTNAGKDVRATLETMCSGLIRCMYCEDGQGGHIDHFRPKVKYPSFCFAWDNLLLACDRCNSNYKRDAFPVDDAGTVLLIDPSSEDPAENLELSLTTGRYRAASEKGRETIRVFGLNRDVCVIGRKDSSEVLCELILGYPRRSEANRAKLMDAIRRHPFQGVRRTLARVIDTGDRADVVPKSVSAVLSRYPELLV